MACIKIIHIINNVYVFLYYTGLLQEVANPGQYFPLALTNDRDRTNPLAQLRAAQPAASPEVRLSVRIPASYVKHMQKHIHASPGGPSSADSSMPHELGGGITQK